MLEWRVTDGSCNASRVFLILFILFIPEEETQIARVTHTTKLTPLRLQLGVKGCADSNAGLSLFRAFKVSI